MTRGRWATALVAVLGAGCGEREEARPAEAASTQPAAPADSLVATAPGGVEVWFTLARESKAADGTTCTDRTLEIRRGDTRTPVPLLYTGTVPEIVNDPRRE